MQKNISFAGVILYKLVSTVCLRYPKVKPVYQVIWFAVFSRRSIHVKTGVQI